VHDNWEGVYEFLGNTENTLFQIWGPHTEKDSRSYIDKAADYASKPPANHFFYTISMKDSNQLIGVTSLVLSEDKLLEKTASLDITINRYQTSINQVSKIDTIRYLFDNRKATKLCRH